MWRRRLILDEGRIKKKYIKDYRCRFESFSLPSLEPVLKNKNKLNKCTKTFKNIARVFRQEQEKKEGDSEPKKVSRAKSEPVKRGFSFQGDNWLVLNLSTGAHGQGGDDFNPGRFLLVNLDETFEYNQK